MSDMGIGMHELASLLTPRADGEPFIRLRRATVVTVAPLTIRLGGNVVPADTLTSSVLVVGGAVTAITRESAPPLVLGATSGVSSAVSGIYGYDGTAVASGVSTALTMTATSDPLGWLSGGDVIPDIPGRYRVTASVDWDTNLTGGTNRHVAAVRTNGSDVFAGVDSAADAPAGPDTNMAVAYPLIDGQTDALDLRVAQFSGASQTPNVLMAVELVPGHA